MAGEEGYPLGALIFLITYLTTIWILNALMWKDLKKLPESKQVLAKWFVLANTFLASGDTVMGIGFFLSFLQNKIIATIEIGGFEIQATIVGIFTTSVTMSIYYLLLAQYYRFKWNNGQNNLLLWIIYVVFAIRILLHLNPYNVWYSLAESEGPNYSSWLRNAPLFIYGLMTVFLIMIYSYKDWKQQDLQEIEKKTSKFIYFAMISLVVSYLCYGADIFFSYLLDDILIHVLYAVKTIAYVVAAAFMYVGAFRTNIE